MLLDIARQLQPIFDDQLGRAGYLRLAPVRAEMGEVLYYFRGHMVVRMYDCAE